MRRYPNCALGFRLAFLYLLIILIIPARANNNNNTKVGSYGCAKINVFSRVAGNDRRLNTPMVSCSCYYYNCSAEAEIVSCDCGGHLLTEIPTDLSQKVHKLAIEDAPIEILRSKSLEAYKSTLTELLLSKVPLLEFIEPDAFQKLTHLRTIYIRQAARLTSISYGVFSKNLPELRAIRIVNSGLDRIPILNETKSKEIIHMVDFDFNKIRNVPSFAFKLEVNTLSLQYNRIEEVEADSFYGSKIGSLSLKGNRALTKLHRDAFRGLNSLRELDLSETSITFLPTLHLKSLALRKLRLQDTHSLKIFPPVYDFRYIEEALLTYPYHCCAFRFPTTHSPEAYASHLKWMEDTRRRLCSQPTSTSPRPSFNKRRRRWGYFGGELESGNAENPERINGSTIPRADLPHSHGFGTIQVNFPTHKSGERSSGTDIFHNRSVDVDAGVEKEAHCGNLSKNYREVRCSPEPDAFNPCEDVMGNVGLRIGVWFVVVAAVLGNLAVMVVLMSSTFKMTVSKFLMCNLAFADFCMGLYLLIVASTDLHTIGEYFNHAIDWQEGPGCQVAGFLTVFASELSIFTLTVITLERWFAITYAIHLNKRLRLGAAARVMIFGWIFALTLATLPILGVSSYTKTSICLPFENSDSTDIVYILTLLTINGLAFVLICACYAKMYWSISGHNSTVTQSDKTVAKRMALLVFTDFACWAPIAFFGLTAVAGYPLINVTNSKILLVFFYPLNSCANPFLYAIFTKQYRRDLILIINRYGSSATSKGTPTYSANLTNTGRRLDAGCRVRRSSLLTQVSTAEQSRNSTKLKNSTGITGTPPPPYAAKEPPAGTEERRSSADINGCCGMSCDAANGSPETNSRRLSIVPENGRSSEDDAVKVSSNKSSSSVSPKHRGSPHPIKNSYTKMSSSSEHELLLQKMANLENWTRCKGGVVQREERVVIVPVGGT